MNVLNRKPATRALAKQACFDCHSNDTAWPAYASIAPVSWQGLSRTLGGPGKQEARERSH